MSGIDERLFQAVRTDDVDAAVAALKSGASANYIHVEEDTTVRDRVPVLYAACKKQNKELVELLLAHGADPNAEYDQSATWGSEHEPCLFGALSPSGPVKHPSAEIVRALLESGADPNVPRVWRENFNNEVFAINRAWGNQELIALLRAYGAGK
ncbi:MAG: hypothetical protein BZY81_05260 [SAR202 cluster bacterium Io17-Chloro-G4]|nr:MAG: hypothetical protein BZY81_05260 [SAR202 cluster bacterium Io17-Chloro-G4]